MSEQYPPGYNENGWIPRPHEEPFVAPRQSSTWDPEIYLFGNDMARGHARVLSGLAQLRNAAKPQETEPDIAETIFDSVIIPMLSGVHFPFDEGKGF